jgi:hypothetical protein
MERDRRQAQMASVARWRYLWRSRCARRAMSADQRAAFEAIVVDGLSVDAAAARLALSEDETLRLFVQAFRIHAAAIDAPGWP